jgi:hypothetical protein
MLLLKGRDRAQAFLHSDDELGRMSEPSGIRVLGNLRACFYQKGIDF